MISSRKTRTAFLSLVFLALVAHPFALCDDYEGVTVKPVQKTRTTANGQKIAYPKTDTPEVTVVIVDIRPGRETGWSRSALVPRFLTKVCPVPVDSFSFYCRSTPDLISWS